MIQTIQRFLKNPKDRTLLLVIVVVTLGFFAAMYVQSGNWLLTPGIVFILTVSILMFGVGIMISDACKPEYRKKLVYVTLLLVTLFIIGAFTDLVPALISNAGVFLFPMFIAILLKNNMLKFIYQKIQHVMGMKKEIKITIHS